MERADSGRPWDADRSPPRFRNIVGISARIRSHANTYVLLNDCMVKR